MRRFGSPQGNCAAGREPRHGKRHGFVAVGNDAVAHAAQLADALYFNAALVRLACDQSAHGDKHGNEILHFGLYSRIFNARTAAGKYACKENRLRGAHRWKRECNIGTRKIRRGRIVGALAALDHRTHPRQRFKMEINRPMADGISAEKRHLCFSRAHQQGPECQDRNAVSARELDHRVLSDSRCYDTARMIVAVGDTTADTLAQLPRNRRFFRKRYVLKNARLVGQKSRHHCLGRGIFGPADLDSSGQHPAAVDNKPLCRFVHASIVTGFFGFTSAIFYMIIGAMKRTTRRIIFYCLALLFAVAGPLAVLTSLGYTFRFSTATFESTGGIFIKSATPRTSVFLDGAFFRETGFLTGSTLMTDIAPGTHHVRLERQGFRPWTKTVTVAPTEVTEFRDVFLVPFEPLSATSTRQELAAVQATSTPTHTFSLDKKNRLRIAENRTSRVVAENVHSFTPTEDGAFFVGQNGFLARFDADSQNVETVGRPGFFLDREPFRFAVSDHFLAIIDSSGGLFLYDAAAGAVRPIASDTQEVRFDSTEEKLLIVKEQSIDMLWLADSERQPFQKRDTMETVAQIPDTIREAYWCYGTEQHAIYRTRAGVFIAETDTRGGSNISELIAGPVDEIITSSLAPSTIFYRKGGTLYKIDL